MSAPAKLPLVTRKNIKDEYESKLPALKEKLKEILGEDLEIKADFPTLAVDSDEGWQKTNPGNIVYDVIERFTEKITELAGKVSSPIPLELSANIDKNSRTKKPL